MLFRSHNQNGYNDHGDHWIEEKQVQHSDDSKKRTDTKQCATTVSIFCGRAVFV